MRHPLRFLHRTIIALAMGLALSIGGVASAQTSFAPALVVNNDVISVYDVEQRMGLLQVLGQGGSDLKGAAEELLIEEALSRQEARRQGFSASPEMIDNALNVFAERRGASIAQIDGALRQAGVDRGSLVALVESQLLWQESMRRRFAARARPTEGEVDAAILRTATEPGREVRLSEIAVPVFERGTEGTRRFIIDLYQDLVAGGDFAAAARRHSRTGSASSGGDLGWLQASTLAPAMRAQVELMGVGDISQPIPITRGVTLLKVTDERPIPTAGAERVALDYALLTFSGEGAATRAAAARTELSGCAAIAPGVAGSSEALRISDTTLADVPSSHFDVLGRLEPGQASRPVTIDGQTAVFVLCGRDIEVSQQERDRIAEQLFASRVSGYAEGYLQDIRRDALIDRRQ